MNGIDCATQITYLLAQNLRSKGINYIGRYMVPDYPSLRWKRLTAPEVQACTELGIKIISIFEISAGDMKGGAQAGIEHGKLAYQEAQSIGQPTGTPIFFTVDYEAGLGDYNIIESYLRAAKEQIPGYKIGCYGSFFVVEEMARRRAADYFWQTIAWSRNNIPISASIYQYKCDTTLAGISVDLNDIYYDEVAWNYNTQKEAVWVDYKTILAKVTDSPDRWEKAIEAIKSINGNLGDLEVLKFMPDLIEKVYNQRG